MRQLVFALTLACGAASAQPEAGGEIVQVLEGRASYYSDSVGRTLDGER